MESPIVACWNSCFLQQFMAGWRPFFTSGCCKCWLCRVSKDRSALQVVVLGSSSKSKIMKVMTGGGYACVYQLKRHSGFRFPDRVWHGAGSNFYHPKIDGNWIELDGLSSRSLKMTSWWVQTVTRYSKLQAQGSAVFSAVCLKQLPLRDGSKLWNHWTKVHWVTLSSFCFDSFHSFFWGSLK